MGIGRECLRSALYLTLIFLSLIGVITFGKPYVEGSVIFSIFRGIVLAVKEKNITFANEKGVHLIDAEHRKI